jgi:flagellar biosynthetic protein FliQ
VIGMAPQSSHRREMMSTEFVIGLAGQALYTVLKLSAPMLGIGLIVGLLVSIFQATTQIQEQTLAFVPKIIAVFLAILVFGPWILNVMMDFTSNLLGNLANYIG